MRKRRGGRESERGQVLYQTALGLTCLLVFVGLVVDGGLMLANYRRAQLTADTAAQAGANAVSVEVFWSSNQVVIAPEAARDTAMWIVDQDGKAVLPGGGTRPLIRDVQVTCGEGWVRVAGQARLPTLFMRMFGIDEIRIPVRSVAQAAFGIEEEWQ